MPTLKCFRCLFSSGFYHYMHCFFNVKFSNTNHYTLTCIFLLKCLRMREDSELLCSFTLVDKYLVVSPIYLTLQLGQVYLYTTKDLRSFLTLSFVENSDPGAKTKVYIFKLF